jgi:hypothetical protein
LFLQVRVIAVTVAMTLAEKALPDARDPFVALRSGGFLDQAKDFLADTVRKNKLMGIGDRSDTRWKTLPGYGMGRQTAMLVFNGLHSQPLNSA